MNDIGVVGGFRAEVRPGQAAAKTLEAVDNGGVGLQTHPPLQSIEKNPGNQAPFSVEHGFLFDNGSHGHYFQLVKAGVVAQLQQQFA